MSKLTRGKKGEQFVIESLNQIKEYHHLLNDVTFLNYKSRMTHQIDHILIHPHGVFVIETKNYYGHIIYDNKNDIWLKEYKKELIRISNPLKQNKSHEITLYRVLSGQIHPVSIVVFVKNNAPYFPDVNVINLSDLLLFIESYPYDRLLSKSEIDRIKNVIESSRIKVSDEEHIANIKALRTLNEIDKDEKTFAIETGYCPKCKGPIITDGIKFICGKCGYKFKL